MNPPPIRTSDSALRDQQWSRLREATSEYLDAQETVKNLRAALNAARATLAWEWRFPEVDVELCLMLKKRITSRANALQSATDALSSLQSELESLRTALDDNYEVSYEPV